MADRAEVKLDLVNVRLSFPQLFEPKRFAGTEGKPAFTANFLMPPNHEAAKKIKEAILEVAEKKWPGKGAEMVTALIAKDAVCFRKGDVKPDYQDYPGNYFLSTRAYTRPAVVNLDGSPLTESDGVIYGGCYVLAKVAIWAQSNNYGKRINATLRGVQFMKAGESFGGGTPASADEFTPLGNPDANNDDLVGGSGGIDPDDIPF